MAVAVKTSIYNKKTLARAVRLRDAALRIRALTEEWQLGVRISSVQRGPFRIRYQVPSLQFGKLAMRVNKRRPRKVMRPPFGVEIIGQKLLLRTEWEGDAILLTLFEQGPWEAEFMRLASVTNRAAR